MDDNKYKIDALIVYQKFLFLSRKVIERSSMSEYVAGNKDRLSRAERYLSFTVHPSGDDSDIHNI